MNRSLDSAYIEDTPERAAERKQNHIDICRRDDVESRSRDGSAYFLTPEALPDFAPDAVDTKRKFLGRVFSWPLLITGMTGGVKDGQRINEILASLAERWDIPMGLGSQKLMLKDPSYVKLFDVRKAAPHAFLIGNIGAVSFNYGIGIDDVVRMVDDLNLNACAVHLNALQEQIQPEGERNFENLFPVIEKLVSKLAVPVVVKEVGSGMSAGTCRRLMECGVAAVDVGGNGGTSWSVIEGLRGDPLTRRLGELFRNWGLSTIESVEECVPVAKTFGEAPPRYVVATGGVRDGAQSAILIALGAQMCGVGLPFFRSIVNPQAGLSPEESLEQEMRFFARSLQIAMYCSGAKKLDDLSARLRKRSAK